MHFNPDQFWLVSGHVLLFSGSFVVVHSYASYLKIYCGPIWRNLHFPVPVDYRNSIASKIDATLVIKAHSIIQFAMPWNAAKMNQRVSRFSNFLGRPQVPAGARLQRTCRGLRPSCAPLWWIGHPPLPNPRSATEIKTWLIQIAYRKWHSNRPGLGRLWVESWLPIYFFS